MFALIGVWAGWRFSNTINTVLFHISHPRVCNAVMTHYVAVAMKVISRPFSSQTQCGDFNVISLEWATRLGNGTRTLNKPKSRDIIHESTRCDNDRFLVARVSHPTFGDFVVFVTSLCDPRREWPFNTDEHAPCDREDISTMKVRFNRSDTQHSMTSWIHKVQGLQAHFGGSTITMRDLAQVWLRTQSERVRADFYDSEVTFEIKTIDGTVRVGEEQTLLDLDDALHAQSISE